MKVLRVRRTRHSVYLLVRCRCGKRFGHRAGRRLVVCYQCGRMIDVARPRRRPPSRPAAPPPPVLHASPARPQPTC